MPLRKHLIRLIPCQDFQIVVWIDSSFLVSVSLWVHLAFPRELGMRAKKTVIPLGPSDKSKTLFLKFHVGREIVWPLPMSLGVITAGFDDKHLLWHSLPKAVVVKDGSEADPYLGIRLKVGRRSGVEYRFEE